MILQSPVVWLPAGLIVSELVLKLFISISPFWPAVIAVE